MKRLLALLLALMMVFSLAACGGDDAADKKGEETKAAEKATEAPTEAPKPNATIGDVTVEYDSAVLYKPYDNEVNKPNLLMYYNFTNNGEAETFPCKKIYFKATQDGNKVSTIGFLEDAKPAETDAYYGKVAPGETVKCAEAFQLDMEGGEVTIEFIDLYNQIEEKLVVTIDPSSLELITESLAVVEETEAE